MGTAGAQAKDVVTDDAGHGSRPRVAGDREVEILEAAIEVLRDAGYDKLTFDAVAATARASKATLYRRWPHKRDLVIDALGLFMNCPAEQDPDTGSLRGDLLAQACADGGLDDEVVIGTWSALLPVIHREAELASGIHERFLAPKIAASRSIFENARARGEIGADADLDTLLMILPSLSIHEALLSGSRPGPDRIAEFVDTVVLPACAATLAPRPSSR
ncbi:TetR/AcrR family transcriptional regulator [Terrabacter sp. MAHUQ-38]|uniref:TetR/AcrR family transcriptional regulator n=1 Tax=unclassified Terrabacter TaxID=2630222 RepID=UPI00165E5899|nr:TetR/AcrR family transcriptional regulator [Terrabacter sp. MAHUQ-38]MBC9822978.1 TetR/AcrR family transcriptional regulator [Terrabacter sp. MAHUQ-38]